MVGISNLLIDNRAVFLPMCNFFVSCIASVISTRAGLLNSAKLTQLIFKLAAPLVFLDFDVVTGKVQQCLFCRGRQSKLYSCY